MLNYQRVTFPTSFLGFLGFLVATPMAIPGAKAATKHFAGQSFRSLFVAEALVSIVMGVPWDPINRWFIYIYT